ncbi:helix-turn-helix domain-containing protein [Polyangium mundeleinium]|uniref:Helix-turn-helix transcriptional regulator n=1 Tax=Polyangium mundeleinium TaxID=2995306 RepID=A0ABT5F7B8_9BACT|nr:helix-turn-helix transcriptional regulator [Polyangium mundeleinium]MDC0750006.1 helix-turn-helix transcriptional regulator [Polyangium mundeleinium]
MSKTDATPKLGALLRESRQKRGMSLRQFGERLQKEDGSSLSPQYLNDIEHGRRNPPDDCILKQMAEVLGLDVQVLLAMAGREPPEVTEYLVEMPEQGQTIGKLFRKARESGFKDWDSLLLEIERRTR